MTESQARKLLQSWSQKTRIKNALNQHELCEFLESLYPTVDIKAQIYCFLRGISPYCVVCNSVLNDCRKQTCSYMCRGKIIDHGSRIEKQKQTIKEQYGVENVRQIPGVEDKRKATMLEKYGSLVSPLTAKKSSERSNMLNHKGRQTLMEKYGVENPGQLPNHTEKCKHSSTINQSKRK